jgi:hypothetical protein
VISRAEAAALIANPAVESKRGPGRPEVGGRVTVNLSPERLARIDAAARLAGVSRAELLRRIIDVALKGERVDG